MSKRLSTWRLSKCLRLGEPDHLITPELLKMGSHQLTLGGAGVPPRILLKLLLQLPCSLPRTLPHWVTSWDVGRSSGQTREADLGLATQQTSAAQRGAPLNHHFDAPSADALCVASALWCREAARFLQIRSPLHSLICAGFKPLFLVGFWLWVSNVLLTINQCLISFL